MMVDISTEQIGTGRPAMPSLTELRIPAMPSLTGLGIPTSLPDTPNLPRPLYSDICSVRHLEPDSYLKETDIGWLRVVNSKDFSTVIFPPKADECPLCRYVNFIITNIHDSFHERVQIVETSKSPAINFFGERSRIVPITGVLKNSAEHPWTHDMVTAWKDMLSGSRLADKDAVLLIYCNGNIYKGYPISFSISISAANDLIANFSLQLAVLDSYPYNGV